MEGPPVTGSWHRQDRTGGPWVEGARGPKGRRRGRGRRPECPLAARFPRLPCASQLRKRHRAPPRRLRRSSKLDSFVIPSPPPWGPRFCIALTVPPPPPCDGRSTGQDGSGAPPGAALQRRARQPRRQCQGLELGRRQSARYRFRSVATATMAELTLSALSPPRPLGVGVGAWRELQGRHSPSRSTCARRLMCR